jgi:hypothetical protein
MIDRLWRADRPFYAQYRDKVDEVQRRLLLQAAKQHLFAARGAQARAHLKRARSMSAQRQSLGESMLRILASIPGSGLVLYLLRAIVHGARQLVAARAARQ